MSLDYEQIRRILNSKNYFLRFPFKLEQSYQHQYREEAAQAFKLRGLIIFALYIILSLGIYKLVPHFQIYQWLKIYSWVGVIILSTWILSLTKKTTKWFDLYTCIGSSLSIAITLYIIGAHNNIGSSVLFHAAMMYAVVIIYAFVGMRFYTACIAGWSGGLIGILASMYFNHDINWTILNRTYTFSSVLAMCLAFATDYRHRHNYLQSLLSNFQSQRLESLSQIDALTGLANRRYLDEVIHNEWNRSIRHQTQLAVMMIDVDFFKKYNDSFGHIQGDHCLKAVADAIAESAMRSGDLAARYGGEEFLLLFTTTDSVQIENQAQRLLQRIENLNFFHPTSTISTKVTISIGAAFITPQMNQSPIDLIKSADRALYKAKNNGRNCYVLSNAELVTD